MACTSKKTFRANTSAEISTEPLPKWTSKQRLEKGKQHDSYLTKQERCLFNSTIPNFIVDPAGNTMRIMFYFMDDPHQMITRSGDLFYFSKWDKKA